MAVAGLLVRGDRTSISRCFGALIALQPLEWVDGGLLCAGTLTEDAGSSSLPLPVSPSVVPSRWPESSADLVSGWYRRTPDHAPAPPGVRELIQANGAGFGPYGHVTTAMCLAALDRLPHADAVDVGCGSGLLTQAWLQLCRGRVLAIDADPAAVAQTIASLRHAGLSGATIRRMDIRSLNADDLAGRIVFANVPAAAHNLLATRFSTPPAGLVVSGIRSAESVYVLDRYRSLGLRRLRAIRRAGFDCHVLGAAT